VAMRFLEKLGHAFDVAQNGREALDLLAQKSYDLVLMDCQMPVMDGYEATRALRDGTAGALNPAIPVIALTANAMQGDREKALAAGMNDHLAKPFSLEELEEKIERWGPAEVAVTHPVATATAAGQPHTPSPALFNVEKMIINLGDDPEIARELLPGGLDDIETHARALLEALNSNDIPTALRHVHTVKGLAGTLGAAASQGIAIAIEKQLKDADIPAAIHGQAELTDSLFNLRQAVEAWLQKS